MLFQPCPVCKAPDTVNADADKAGMWSPPPDTCTCEECGARFEIEPDADWTGDGYRDCSTVGKRIKTGNQDA